MDQPMSDGRPDSSSAQRTAGRDPPSNSARSSASTLPAPGSHPNKARQRSRRKATEDDDDPSKRRCVSTACIACRRRKSKCDGNLPACAACSQVYGTDCVYDPNSDHRRKGVYKNDAHDLKTRDSTLQILIQAILNYPEDEVPALIRDIRTCESLDAVADKIVAKENGLAEEEEEDESLSPSFDVDDTKPATLESHLYGKMLDLRLDDGSIRYFGGTSNLIHLAPEDGVAVKAEGSVLQQENAVTSWTDVTKDRDLILHLLNMYFTWHYTYFTCLSKELFYRDFFRGNPPAGSRPATYYCTPFLLNVILSLGCHFTSHAGAREHPEDSATAGDHFFREAKRLMMEHDEHEHPHITTVQALALMSVREAGCGREARGWIYSGMSFRMACDMGLNLDTTHLAPRKGVSGDENEQDARRITFWGCYLFDKCWSNYMGRLPQLPTSNTTASKYDVFPSEEASQWSPYTDSGFSPANAQPSRTRTVALQILKLCEISNDLMQNFYNPIDIDKTKGKAAELKKLSDIHTRLESWRRELPKELEPIEGGLSSVLIMHMFSWLLLIHLFRPFLKYTQATSPLPSTVSPRKLCTQAAGMISKLMRLYKRSHGLRQICNIAVYMVHSACTIHLLNLPDKNAKRDITHGVKHLEEIAEGWLCARRTLTILSALARKWNVILPDDAATVLARTEAKFGSFQGDVGSPTSQHRPADSPGQASGIFTWQGSHASPIPAEYPGESTMILTPNAITTLGPQPLLALGNSLQSAKEPGNTSAGTTAASLIPSSRVRTQSTPASKPSPGDMFGGIEQLIRDSQDWAYRDQQQLATGFENWTALDLDSLSTWTTTPAAGNSIPAFVRPPNTNGLLGVAVTTPLAPAVVSRPVVPALVATQPGGLGRVPSAPPGRAVNGFVTPGRSPSSTVQRNGDSEVPRGVAEYVRQMSGDMGLAGVANGGTGSGGGGGGGDIGSSPELTQWLQGMNAYGNMDSHYNEEDWYQ